MTTSDVRTAHKLLDRVSQGRAVLEEEISLLRSFLPELPAQKTLEEITELVNEAWSFTHVNEWDDDAYGSLESWLSDLETQLQGVKETSANVPELPVGMRLAKHENRGLVVATGWIDGDNEHFCVYRSDVLGHGTYAFLPESSLTYLDSEPAKPSHPEFLQTGAEYQEAPWGTIVAQEGTPVAWVKKNNGWSSTDGGSRTDSQFLWGVPRKVLRWGEGA